MTQPELHQLHAVVHGRVQGVGFRDFTRYRALELGLTGWVRNLADGTVEVTAEGDRATLERLITFLNRGPTSARVTAVDTDWHTATGSFDHFGIR
jgi:acylphosphatase